MKERDNIESIVIPVMYNFNFKNPSQVICRGILAPKICQSLNLLHFLKVEARPLNGVGPRRGSVPLLGRSPVPNKT